MPDRRLKAVWDVKVPVIRELAGVHEYDGVVMDLSPSGHKAALDRLGPSSPGERLADRHDESHLSAAAQAARAEDRKSTRLNSSHMSISYAVFCLKKKN